MLLKLQDIRLDGGTQPRAQLLLEVMEDYAERMLNGVEFPPITVFFDGKDYWLADGFHRVGAAKQARPDQPIEANVRQGTQSDAQWYSFGVNQTHGLRRTREDRARAIRAALHHPVGTKKSDRDLAQHIGVDHKTVAKYRSELTSTGEIPQLKRRLGLDGKQRPATQPDQREGSRPKSKSNSRRGTKQSRLAIHQPTISPSPMEAMTAISLPHNPAAGAPAC
jgi:hypothetical protein